MRKVIARHLEEVTPHMAGEDRIPVADDRRREAVEPYNAVEECPGDQDGSVGVAERDEVGVLGEAIDDGKDNRLAADPRKALDEIHSDVGPHRVWNVERLEEPRRVQVLCLVALANSAALDELPYLA